MKKTLLFRLVAMVAILLPISATSQIINSFPYSEDIESWNTCSTSCSAGCALPNGWTNTGAQDWRTDSFGTGSSNTGPSVDHTTGLSSGKYLYTEASGCLGPWELVSPPIDLVGTNGIQFTFWWHAYGGQIGTSHVDVSNDGGATWTNDVVAPFTDNQDLWQFMSVNLVAWVGDTVNVRIRNQGATSFGADFALDDFYLYDILAIDAGVSAFVNPVIPTCNFNDSVSVLLTNYGGDTLTSVNINWSHNGLTLPSVPWTGSLAPGTDTVVFVGTTTFASGSDLVAYTTLPNGVNELTSPNPVGAVNDTSSIIGLSTGLSGIYTIGGTTPDYIDITSAVDALNLFGTCGPVIFDIRDGIYPETMSLIDIPSVDAMNSVTFRSESADASLVTITTTGTNTASNFVINLDGTDHYRFENLTLENTATSWARIVQFANGCDSNTFEGCHMMSTSANTTSLNAAMIYSNNTLDFGNHFMNNIIEGGSYGLYFYGGGTTSSEAGTVVEGNHFLNNYWYGARLYYQDGLIFKNNVIDGTTTYTGTRYGLYGSYLNQGPQITGNTIVGEGASGWNYGIYWFNGGGTPAVTGVIENNMINAGKPGFTGTGYGIYLSNIGYMDIQHNTVHFANGGTNSRAFYPASGGANKVKNNIFSITGGGYAYYLQNAFAVAESDYNVIYAPNGNAGFIGGAQATLADWQGASGFDANSIDFNPMFFSDNDLHVCSDSIGNQGTPIASITMDVDGQMRSTTTPDMGADEYSGLVGSFLGSDVAVCTGDSIMISAGSPSDTILWSTGATTPFIWVSNPGTYTVTINSACGSGTDAIVVNQSALVYSNYVAYSALEFCAGDSVLLNGTQMATTYQWAGGSTSTNDSIYATTGGVYTLNITDGCGTGSESIVLVENNVPNPTFTSSISYLTGTFNNTTLTGANPTYAWDFGDGMSSSVENPAHIYAASGEYVVTLTVTNDCGSTTVTDTILLAIQGIDELLVNGDVTVYPNPSNGEFTIDMELISNSNVSFRVENLIGAIVYESNTITVDGAHSETISLDNVPTGVYFVNILVGDNKLVKKLIIE